MEAEKNWFDLTLEELEKIGERAELEAMETAIQMVLAVPKSKG